MAAVTLTKCCQEPQRESKTSIHSDVLILPNCHGRRPLFAGSCVCARFDSTFTKSLQEKVSELLVKQVPQNLAPCPLSTIEDWWLLGGGGTHIIFRSIDRLRYSNFFVGIWLSFTIRSLHGVVPLSKSPYLPPSSFRLSSFFSSNRVPASFRVVVQCFLAENKGT